MNLCYITDKVICRESEKYMTCDTFLLTEVIPAYDDVSRHQLVFLLSDPSRHPSAGRGLHFAPNFVLY